MQTAQEFSSSRDDHHHLNILNFPPSTTIPTKGNPKIYLKYPQSMNTAPESDETLLSYKLNEESGDNEEQQELD